jgi:aryl-alcohol dehydrogenase-like predicted oxidoreductase
MKTALAGSLGAALPLAAPMGNTASQIVPKRTLGKTGMKISVLSFGGGSQFLNNPDGTWEPMLEKAIEDGINLFDTSPDYTNPSMSSEERFGEILPAYRDRIYISTKFDRRVPNQALQEFERSLNRMKIDYVDILLIHSIEEADTISALEKGVYKRAQQLKEEGVVKYIGFSSMNSANRSREFLEKLDVDVCLLALSPTGYGNFISRTLPVAHEKNVGVLAMKIMRDVVGKNTPPQELLNYAWTLPGVASAVVGHHRSNTLQENISIARQLTTSSIENFDRYSAWHEHMHRKLAHLSGPHALCWAREDYPERTYPG